MNIICDLDGTIALDNGRAKYLHTADCVQLRGGFANNHEVPCICLPHERDWSSYFNACETDEPCDAVITLLRLVDVSPVPAKIYILSGRSMSAHEKTLKWLEDNNVPYNYLQMRSQDDRTADDELKLKWADVLGLTPKNTLFVLEDRTRVVDAWRAKGFRCFQVAPGNF